MAEAVRKNMQKKMGRMKYVRAELSRLRQRATMAAEEVHSGSKDLDDPEIYIDTRRRQAQEKLKMNVKNALKDIEEMGRNEAKYEECIKNAKAKQEEDEKMN